MMKSIVIILLVTMTNAIKRCENVSENLEDKIQSVVRMMSNRTGFAISVGYVDACGREIGAAAGSRNIPETSTQSTTPKDRYTYGSGTKGLTATAVMRLVDRNVLSLKDPAFRYVD